VLRNPLCPNTASLPRAANPGHPPCVAMANSLRWPDLEKAVLESLPLALAFGKTLARSVLAYDIRSASSAHGSEGAREGRSRARGSPDNLPATRPQVPHRPFVTRYSALRGSAPRIALACRATLDSFRSARGGAT